MTTDTAALLRHLADIVSRLRHMWDDTDGDTHMPVEESDDISAIGTEIASLMGCPDSWSDISDALQSRAANIDHAERVENETEGALVAAVTAAHDNDLSAASDAATCAFAVLGLDSALRVRVERADSLAPGLPEGWAIGIPTTHPDGVVSFAAFGPNSAYVMLHMHTDGRATWSRVHAAPTAVDAYLLARAQGVGS